MKWNPAVSPITGAKITLFCCWYCLGFKYSDETEWNWAETQKEFDAQIKDAVHSGIETMMGHCPRHG